MRERAFHQLNREIEVAYFDLDRKPVGIDVGYTRLATRYGASGRVTERAYFYEKAQHAAGYAVVRYQYDASGNRTEVAYFDTAGQPARHPDGHRGYTSQYDAQNREIERAFFDMDRKPVAIKYGYAAERYQHDTRGNRTETAYFDTSGQPTRNHERIARWTSKFDEQGHETERSFFDENGQPCELAGEGIARWTKQYDEAGNIIGIAVFDVAGQPLEVAVPLAVAAGVETEGPALDAGVQPGDVILRWGSWAWSREQPLEELSQAIQRHQETDKQVVLYRTGQGITVHDFPPGKAGIRVVTGFLTKEKIEQLEQAFAEYRTRRAGQAIERFLERHLGLPAPADGAEASTRSKN